MEFIHKDKDNHLHHILCNDHIPNPAFINEFQTQLFSLKLHCIEMIEGILKGYYVDEGGAYFLFPVKRSEHKVYILFILRNQTK